MNRNQRIALWVGIGVFVFMGLFPIDLDRLFIRWAIVTVITGAMICVLRSRKKISRVINNQQKSDYKA